MTVYHGSQQIVERPAYGKGKEENDYGRGFYCTESLELAKEWACPVLKDGYANRYELDTASLSVLDLNSGAYHILNWLALLMKNRRFDLSKNKALGLRGREYIIEHFLPDTSGYDIIKGYRADDRYFAFAKDFVQGGISVRQLASAMKLGGLGEQIVLMSEKAFGNIRFIEYEISDSGIYYHKRNERERLANEAFGALQKEAVFDKNDLFILDIIREGVTDSDPRLR